MITRKSCVNMLWIERIVVMKKINKPVFTVICYVLAIILVCYAIFTIKTSYDYISGLVLQGQVTWMADIKNIISYFVSGSIEYLFYAFSFVFFGKVIDLITPKMVEESDIEASDEIIEEVVIPTEEKTVEA